MAEAIHVLTPIGRLVFGHPMELQTIIDDKTKQPKIGKDGKPETVYRINLAFPKVEPGIVDSAGRPSGAFMRDVWSQMAAAAQRDWPSGEYNSPSFAWKLVDGDGRNKKGKAYADYPGCAGHWILKCQSGYAFQVVGADGARIITNPQEIKRGYYLRAYVSIKGNGPVNQSPGLYVNIGFVQLCAFGEEITSGPDVSAVLAAAGAMPALPAGASATPVNPAPALPGAPAAAPGLPAVPGASMLMPGAPAAAAPPPLPNAAPPLPAAPAAPAWPPAGWTVHPASPTHYFRGSEVKSEAELRAMTVAAAPQLLIPPGTR